MPLLLGRRLDPLILRTLLKGLASRNRFVTSHGLATESVSSPLYRPDGYWRGPIWAPSTLLILTALRDLGEHELASRIALRFCSTCARSGMAENFDALTGEGLRDRAYTWTSSVFLHLASEYSSV